MADRIAGLHLLCSQVFQIAFNLCIEKDRLGHKADPMCGSLFNTVFRRKGNVFYPDVWFRSEIPFFFLNCPVHHSFNGFRSHSMHGKLAMIFLTEINSRLHLPVTAHRNPPGIGIQVRLRHPGGLS